MILVDDGSVDRSVDIASKFPVNIIKNTKNLGPVRSRNIGAKKASGKYLLFLDSDTTVDLNYLTTLVDFLEKHQNVGIVSGKILSEKGERMWFNFGWDPSPVKDQIAGFLALLILKNWNNKLLLKLLSIMNYPFSLNLVEDKIRAVDWVVEMAFIITKDLFEKLGGFDENLFMFYEGPDLCKRVRKMGFQIYYLPDVSVRHLGGHSHQDKRGELFKQSKKYYYKKHPRLF